MKSDKPLHRLTLRELLTQTGKTARDVAQQVQRDVLPLAGDFRHLSRPVRRRSQYPTILALQNALAKLEDSQKEALTLSDALLTNLSVIREKTGQETGTLPMPTPGRDSA